MNKLATLIIAAVIGAPAIAGADTGPTGGAAAVTQSPTPAEPTSALAAAAPSTKPAPAPTSHADGPNATAKHDVPAEAHTPSAPDSTPSPLADLRLAYQNAWAQRQSGDYELAAQTAAHALEHVDHLLAAGTDQSSRGELNELRSRFAG